MIGNQPDRQGPFQSSSTLIFNAEADRLEAGGFNLVMDIN